MKEPRCGWAGMYKCCDRKCFVEMKALGGGWTPICNFHLAIKKRNERSNPWSLLLPVTTREITTLKEKHD